MKAQQERNYIAGICTGILLLCCCFRVQAQQEHTPFLEGEKWLRLAATQYAQSHYRLAIQSVQQSVRPDRLSLSHIITGAEKEAAAYYQVLSLLYLDEAGATDTALQFIQSAPAPAYADRAAFALARFYFRSNKFAEAIPFYEQAGVANLNNKEIAESRFEHAYCYFNNRQFDKAEPLLASVRKEKGHYYAPANYYYGLLAYHNGRYADALSSFSSISNEPHYRHIVPYYVAEIHYFSGDRKKALEEALKLIRRKEKLYYDNELHLLAAQILFEEQRYGDALPYFEHYYDNTEMIRKEELYEMAYSYYRVSEWGEAIQKFRPLSNTRDSLGQTAMYLLGDCYLRTEDKKGARNAFGFCADMPFNKVQQEAALLLFGKLSYEMGYYQDASVSFSNLLHLYPASEYSTEARTLLSELYLRTNNYAEAYQALQKGDNNDPGYRKARQKVTYGYAMEQIANGNLPFADNLLDISLQNRENRDYELAALFWRGEVLLRLEKAAESIPYFNHFIAAATVAYPSPVSRQAGIPRAYLSLGYALMETGNYTEAETAFGLARHEPDASGILIHTAILRQADAAFMQKKFKEAATLYDQIILSGHEEADYAYIQRALILGIQHKTQEKTNMLRQVMNRQPPSAYAREARYQLGITLIEEEKYTQAITVLQPLTDAIEGRNFSAQALLRTGFAWQAMQNNNKAIAAYKQVVAGFPASEERIAALNALRSIYVADNRPEVYAALLKEYQIVTGDSMALDSAYYAAAEAQIASGNWEEAAKALTAYLKQYPDGSFTTKAYYYKAESYYQQKDFLQAMICYDTVLLLPWNEFTESSARRAADIAFSLKDYAAAMRYFGQLRDNALNKENLQTAYSGLMQAAYHAGDYTLSEQYADTLLTMSAPDDIAQDEVRFYKAKALQQQQKNEAALLLYERTKKVSHPAIAAETGYRIAQIHALENRLKEAEAAAVENIKTAAGNEYWVVKSYLLLADMLMRQQDYFNAKATLQSIIKNAKDADMKKEASGQLEEVIRLEKKQSKLKED